MKRKLKKAEQIVKDLENYELTMGAKNLPKNCTLAICGSPARHRLLGSDDWWCVNHRDRMVAYAEMKNKSIAEGYGWPRCKRKS